jgi:hypothetical protein
MIDRHAVQRICSVAPPHSTSRLRLKPATSQHVRGRSAWRCRRMSGEVRLALPLSGIGWYRSPTFCCLVHVLTVKMRPGSSVGMATGYGLDGPGIESWWGEIFRTCPDRFWDPPSLLYNGYRVFPGGRKRSGRDADPSPPSSAEV